MNRNFMIAKNTMEKAFKNKISSGYMAFLRMLASPMNSMPSSDRRTQGQTSTNTPTVPTRPFPVFAKAKLCKCAGLPRVLAAPIVTHLLPVMLSRVHRITISHRSDCRSCSHTVLPLPALPLGFNHNTFLGPIICIFFFPLPLPQNQPLQKLILVF
jgi:hypothetical protein